MLHPSYTDLMKVVNQDVEEGATKIVNSRYSIVLATSKRARQIIGGELPLVPSKNGDKPLSVAIEELNNGKIKIIAEDAETLEEQTEEVQAEEAQTEEQQEEQQTEVQQAEEQQPEEQAEEEEQQDGQES